MDDLAPMELRFTKMHGLGNDFVVIDATSEPFSLTTQQIRRLAHRRTGVGFDQLLVVELATTNAAQFTYRIFNADGAEVEHCGNGARCFARFVLDRGLTDGPRISVMTCGGLLELIAQNDGQVTVCMGVPVFEPVQIPFVADGRAAQYPLKLATDEYSIGAMAIGNPHAVMWVEGADDFDVATIGPQVERHERFPNRVNAGFAEVVDRSHIRLRVYERGVGETLACGTGACAAVVIGALQGRLDNSVTVHLRGGDLRVRWAGEGQQVEMTGPCKTVYEGNMKL